MIFNHDDDHHDHDDDHQDHDDDHHDEEVEVEAHLAPETPLSRGGDEY